MSRRPGGGGLGFAGREQRQEKCEESPLAAGLQRDLKTTLSLHTLSQPSSCQKAFCLVFVQGLGSTCEGCHVKRQKCNVFRGEC